MTKSKTTVTMMDVARNAGVSIATVSRVINGQPGVSSGAAERVRAAISTLGYETSLVASSLRRSRKNVLGLVAHSFESYTAEILKGVMDALGGSGLDLIVYAAGDSYGTESHGWEQRQVTLLSGTLADGCLVVAPWTDVRNRAPVVAIDPVRGSRMHAVMADNFAGSVVAVEHLLALGHRRIGLIGGRVTLAAAWSREEGYRHALDQAGIDIDETLIGRGDFHPDTAVAPANALLDLAEPPTAIFAASDGMALKVLEVARARGLDVPGDLSIVGFDNIPESALSNPPLTTVDQSVRRLGYEAARLLMSLVIHPAHDIHQVLVPTELVVRGSTGPPRTS